MTVYIVVDDSQSCYDAGGIFVAVFSTREKAELYIKGNDMYEIYEETIDSEFV